MRGKTKAIECDAGDPSVLSGDGMGCVYPCIGLGTVMQLTEAGVKFLSDEQALTLRSINGQRDAAEYYPIDMSEHQSRPVMSAATKLGISR